MAGKSWSSLRPRTQRAYLAEVYGLGRGQQPTPQQLREVRNRYNGYWRRQPKNRRGIKLMDVLSALDPRQVAQRLISLHGVSRPEAQQAVRARVAGMTLAQRRVAWTAPRTELQDLARPQVLGNPFWYH